MPEPIADTTDSGQDFASIGDIERLEDRLTALEEHVVQMGRDAWDRANKNADKISILYGELKTQQERADRLEAAMAEMAKTLAMMAREADRAGNLLGQVEGRLLQNGETLAQIAEAAARRAQAEALRRQDFSARLERLQDQQAAQVQAFAQAISRIEEGLQALARAEHEGAQQLGQALTTLHAALTGLQDQVQAGWAAASEAAEGRARAAAGHAQAEEAALAQLLAGQSQGPAQLRSIAASAGELAAASQALQAHQQARVRQAALERARALNRQALPLLGKAPFAAVETERDEAAIALLEEAARLAPEDTVVTTNLALAYLQAGELEHAEELLRLALAREPEAAYALNALGLLALRRGRAREARIPLQQAAALAPEDATIQLNLGKAHYGCGEIRPAIESWRRAQALDPALVARDSAVSILLDEQARLEGTA